MKKSLIAIAGVAMFSCASAAYSSTGVYLSLNGGIAMLNDIQGIEENGEERDEHLEMSSGLALIGAVGYDFGPARLEAEFGYQENDGDQLVSNDRSTRFYLDDNGNIVFSLPADDVAIDATTVFLNGYLDFSNSSPFTPYIGAGIGVLNLTAEDSGESFDDTVLGFQAGAGFDISLNEIVSLGLKYRYLSSIGDVEFDNAVVEEYSSHNIYGGLKFTF